MRNLLILSILVIVSSSSQGQDYVANWVTTKEIGVINFQVQKSSDKVNWATLPNGTLSPKKKDTNRYTFTLPLATNYYRIKTLFSDTIIYTSSKKVVNTNVVVSSPKLKINTGSDNLSFTALNEAAIDYYSIERQNSSSTKWVIAGKLTQSNKKNYVVNISKVGTSRKYRVRSFYKKGIVSPYINFTQ